MFKPHLLKKDQIQKDLFVFSTQVFDRRKFGELSNYVYRIPFIRHSHRQPGHNPIFPFTRQIGILASS